MRKKANYQRRTATTTVSLPIALLDKLNETLSKDTRFGTRSQLAQWLFAVYVKNFESKYGEGAKT